MADDILKLSFPYVDCYILIQIPLKFVPKRPNNNKATLV